MNFKCYSYTHEGKQRPHNEDSVLSRPEKWLWVVADGMGGHEKGDAASQLVTAKLSCLDLHTRLSLAIEQLENTLLHINQTLSKMAAVLGTNATIGTTVVGLLARGSKAICFWAGDSRLYLLRQKNLRQITADHSLVQQMVKNGLITRDQAERHPASNVISRAIGAQPILNLDLEAIDLCVGDRLLLCSDGLYKELSDAEIESIMCVNVCVQSTGEKLADAVFEKAAADNFSFIIVEMLGS